MRCKLLVSAAIALALVPSVFAQDVSTEVYTLADLPILGTTSAGQEIHFGGFSGLFYEGTNDEGELVFITHTDRGPNAEPVDTNGDGVNERPFALPDFQLEWVRLGVNRDAGTIHITERIPLTLPDGSPLTGLPNMAGEPGMAYSDETPIDVNGNVLELAPLGGDLEGILRVEDGTYWMVDEYRPAIYHFTAEGQMINRYIPDGEGMDEFGVPALPAHLAQRRANRGFEAVAYDNGKLYAFVQSPLDNPDTGNDASSKAGNAIRIVEFDIATETVTAEYLYIFEAGVDKIGDAAALGNGEFLVMDRDDATGPEALKRVYQISIAGATNLLDVADDVVIESLTTPEALADAGIVPVTMTLYVDLIAAGYDAVDKTEGLAIVEPGVIAVVNDNDFQIGGSLLDATTGLLEVNPDPSPVNLGIFTVGS